jgi:uncharacterized surface protein with fasciclin (FAS1) repeats
MTHKFRKAVTVVLTLLLLLSLVPLAAAAPPLQTEAQPGLVDVARDEGRFTTFIEALERSGLDQTLAGEGPYTVFAPTDEAFARLPEGTLENLFANADALENLLLYHVVEGRLMAADLAQADEINTLTGQTLSITAVGGTLQEISGAQVTEMDLEAANGVIHVLDTVLMPQQLEDAQPAEEPTVSDIPTQDPAGPEDIPQPQSSVVQAGTTTPDETQAGGTVATPAGCRQNYVIQVGDTLSLLAQGFLGDLNAYSSIAEATNRAGEGYATIVDPNIIVVGETLCIPGSAGTPALTPAESEATTPQDTLAGGEVAAAVPEGMSRLVFENLSSVDLVLDLSGPTRDSLVIPPGAKQEFIIEPGQYNYNAHQPGGDYSVQPGAFDIAAGRERSLVCFDSPVCELQAVTTLQAPQSGQTEGASPLNEPTLETTTTNETTTADGTTTNETTTVDETVTEDEGDTTTDDQTPAEETVPGDEDGTTSQ